MILFINKFRDYTVIMIDQNHRHNVNFRLNDENMKKLELLAESKEISKSELARKIIVDKLNDSLNEMLQNVVPYPQPLIKKIFDTLDESQKDNIILEFNHYYQPLVESAKFVQTPHEIVMLMNKWLKNAGCKVNLRNFKFHQIMDIHHFMGKTWSEVTCVTIAYGLSNLGYQIVRTFSEETWFKIEFTEA